MNIFKRLLDGVFPENLTCELCGREVFDGQRLCGACIKKVPLNDGNCCPVCGRKTVVSQICIECKNCLPKFDAACSALVYDDGVKRLIHSFKNGKAYLDDYLAEFLVNKCKNFTDAQAICYVPSYIKTQKKRGYNQAKRLADSLSKLLNLPVIDGAVKKIKNSKQQKSLTKREREENLSGCFKAEKSLVFGKILLLVDDVLTTGATADAVSAELKKRGAAKVYFASVASVEYKSENL